MSKHPHYEIRLADSNTLETIAFMKKARQRRLSLVYNRPGQFDGTVKIDDDVAYALARHSTCIIPERNGVPIWSGPIFGITDDAGGTSETTSFTANGWYEELNHRFLSRAAADLLNPLIAGGTWTGGNIANWLVYNACDNGDYNLAVDSLGNLNPTHVVTSSMLGLSGNHNFDTQTRKRSYQQDQSIGSIITELIDIENGMDISIDPMQRYLSTYPPSGVNALWTDRKDVHFGFGLKPNNISKIRRIEDGMRTANTLIVTGANGLRVVADDPASIAREENRLEDVLSLGDVNDATILAAYANAELVYRALGAVTVSITPKSLPESGEIYRPFEHYNLGDQIYVSCDRGRLQLRKLPMRVFGLTIDINDNGEEIVSEIQATAS